MPRCFAFTFRPVFFLFFKCFFVSQLRLGVLFSLFQLSDCFLVSLFAYSVSANHFYSRVCVCFVALSASWCPLCWYGSSPVSRCLFFSLQPPACFATLVHIFLQFLYLFFFCVFWFIFGPWASFFMYFGAFWVHFQPLGASFRSRGALFGACRKKCLKKTLRLTQGRNLLTHFGPFWRPFWCLFWPPFRV